MLALHLGGTGQGGNEFFSQGPLTRSDTFDCWGSGTGVVPTIPFPKVRRRLLELLVRCPVGVWLRTASLVEYLWRNDPWFLIPKEIPPPPGPPPDPEADTATLLNASAAIGAIADPFPVRIRRVLRRWKGGMSSGFSKASRWCSATWTWPT